MNGMCKSLLIWTFFYMAISLLWAGDQAGQPTQQSLSAGEWKVLQGVWKSSPEAKKRMEVMIMDHKVGFEIHKGEAKEGESLLSFVALSPAEMRDEKGKRVLEIPISKDYSRKLAYRFDKDHLVIDVPGHGEIPLERASTLGSTNADAKKLLGSWTITEAEAGGTKRTPKNIGLDEIVFQEDRYILKASGKELLNSFYRVDATSEPAVMDWYGMKTSFVIPLIYEIKGAELKLCHPLLGKEAPKKRPTSFDTKEVATLLIRAKRAAKD